MVELKFMLRYSACILSLFAMTFTFSVAHASNIRIADVGAYTLNQKLVSNIKSVGNYFLSRYSMGNLQYLAKTRDGLYDVYIISYGTGIHNGLLAYYAAPDGYIEKVAVSWDTKDKIAQDASLCIMTPLLSVLGLNSQEMDVLYHSLGTNHFPVDVWCNNLNRRIFLTLEMDADGIVRFIYTAGD